MDREGFADTIGAYLDALPILLIDNRIKFGLFIPR